MVTVLKEARRETEWEYRCHAPESFFVDDWDKVSLAEDIEKMNEQGGLPCDGGGRPGPWCTRCFWGREEDF